MYIVNVFLFLPYCKDIYNFETIFSGRDYACDDISYKSDSRYGCVRAAALWDADNERHGYSIKSKISRTKEQITNYIPLYVKCTGRIQFMLYHNERITHKNYFIEQWLINNECERKIWTEAVEDRYEKQPWRLLGDS